MAFLLTPILGQLPRLHRPLVFSLVFVNIEGVKRKPSSTTKSKPQRKSKPKAQGNYIDTFVKRMFGQVLVFIDFLVNYADKQFVAEIDETKVQLAPTHYIGAKGDERIVDLVFQCPLKSGNGSLMAVIIFEHQGGCLKKIPQKLLRYISAIWDAETKEGKPLSAPYFIVLRTGQKPYRGRVYPKMLDSLPKRRDGKPVGKMVDIEFDVVDLPAWNFNDLVGGAVLRSTLMMLHRITGGKLDDFQDAFRPLLELPEDEQVVVSKEMLDFADIAFKAHNRRLDAATVSKALKVFKEKEQNMIKSIFDEKIDEGIAIGEAKAGRNMVLTVLRARFKRVPKEVEKAILAMNDTISLESWAAQAATCESMGEFAEMLR